MADDDAECLNDARNGDQAAARRVVETFGPYLFRVARSLTNSVDDAEDAVQETFAAAFRGKFRGESSLKTWLVKILVRQAALQRRSRQRWPRIWRTDDSRDEPASEINDTLAVDARLDFVSLLARLSEEHREVILLREIEQLSYAEIAVTLGLPQGTIESRLHRAREELKRLVKR